MKIPSEDFLNLALENLNNSQGVDFDFSARLTQQSIAYSLIAIGQELKKFNDRIDKDRKVDETLEW